MKSFHTVINALHILTTYKNLDTVTTKNDNKNWLYRMLIIGPSGSGKTNALLNLIKQDNSNLSY